MSLIVTRKAVRTKLNARQRHVMHTDSAKDVSEAKEKRGQSEEEKGERDGKRGKKGKREKGGGKKEKEAEGQKGKEKGTALWIEPPREVSRMSNLGGYVSCHICLLSLPRDHKDITLHHLQLHS